MNLPRKSYLIGSFVLSRAMPRFLQVSINRVICHACFLVMSGQRRIVQKNLSIILDRSPEDPLVRKLALRTFQNYGLYLIDYVQINTGRPYLTPEQQGSHYMRQALDQGRGAIVITPHLGNWELGSISFAQRGTPMHALTVKDSDTEVQEFRDRMRRSLGIKTVHIDAENYGTIIRLAGLLKNNQVIAMLGDRWETGKKVDVSFFNRKVFFPAGATALSLTTGAPIIPAFTVVHPNGRYAAWMEPPIHVTRRSGIGTSALILEKTQEIAKIFESVIARYPDQFYHFSDYWEAYGC